MMKRILVPITGDERSETIVPVVAALGRDRGASVRLLRVFPVPEAIVGTHGRTVAYADQEMERLTGEALVDLRRVEAQLETVPVESVIRFGEPVEEIVLEAEAFGADLIALAGAARGRLRGALDPGVAAEVARKAPMPTLIVHVGGPEMAPHTPRRSDRPGKAVALLDNASLWAARGRARR